MTSGGEWAYTAIFVTGTCRGCLALARRTSLFMTSETIRFVTHFVPRSGSLGPRDAHAESQPDAPLNASRDSGVSATATVRPKPVRPLPDVLPQWRVLLHDDNKNDMDYVVETVVKIARLNRPTATRCMMEAHKKGVGQVIVTHRERAEFLADQFQSCRLTVSIEPVR